MITEWLMKAVSAFWSWFIGNLPALPTPSWFSTVSGAISGITDHIAGLGAWFPFGVLGAVLATFFAVLAVGWLVKLARIVASLLTLGGGGAG